MNKLLLFCFILFSFSAFSAKKSDTSKVEWIKVYFNSTSDHKVAFEGNKSNDLHDLMATLIDRIDSAKYSIDLAAYDFQNMRVAHALANASRRGVRVRVVTDNSNRERSPRFNIPLWDTLRKAGIYSIDDAGTIYHPNGEITALSENLPNAGAIMHHKFAVIDMLSEDPDDYYVWTGSMNITYTGPWNTNVTFVIKDSGVAGAYANEFQQMWGSKSNVPNANKARFHKDKYNYKQKTHYVDSIKIEVYFGPLDRGNTKQSISKRVTELINNYAKHDINFLAFAISPNIDISQAMIKRSGRGEIRLNGVIDPAFYARYRNQNEIWAKPEMSFGNRLILSGKEVRKLHAKTIIIDALYPYKEKHKSVVIAGSYNFSIAAELANDENILIIYDNNIANQFYQDFMGVMSRAKRETYHRYPDIDTTRWYDNFRIESDGKIELEVETGVFYPISLLGVDIPNAWAGHKDSSFYYSEEAVEYLKNLLEGTELKITAGREKPEHIFGRYFGYIKAKKDSIIFDVNRNMLLSGNATYSTWNRQQRDSIVAFKVMENVAKHRQVGMWAEPERVNTKQLTTDAERMKTLFPLDINLATEEELAYIPGVGPKTAENIIAFRDEYGFYSNLDQLLGIRGIGDKTLEKLKEYLIIED